MRKGEVYSDTPAAVSVVAAAFESPASPEEGASLAVTLVEAPVYGTERGERPGTFD